MNYYLIIICIFMLIFIILLIKTFYNSSLDILLSIPDETINVINVTENEMEGKEIPLNIFMTWETKYLPLYMKQSIEMVKSKNSDFNVYIYDDKDCRNFLKKYFIDDVVNAFDNLIPGAYKADLWRYCVLYYYGGIYQDIKFQPVGNFKYEQLLDKEYFVRDIEGSGSGIYNAFMVCKARNEILYKCIKKIIYNVKNKYYGTSPLKPTGPLLMKKFFTSKQIYKLELYNKSIYISGIYKNDKKILDFYKNYRKEQKKASKPHYSYLYKIKKIYV